jgi:outer membrane immunogenic protein
MRKLVSTGIGLLVLAAAMVPAAAADLPIYREPGSSIYIDPWSWNGGYIGLNGGYSWGQSSTDAAFTRNSTVALFGTNNTFNLNGGLFGGQIGVNWQIGNFVAGFETDLQWTGQSGSVDFTCGTGACTAGSPVVGTVNEKLVWLGTFRTRLGVTPVRPIVVYVTGGAAYGVVQTDVLVSGSPGGVPMTAAFTDSVLRFGWTAGAGIEGRLYGNWTGRVEYLYVDLRKYGTGPLVTPIPALGGGGLNTSFDSRISDNIFRVGINYQLSPWVSARY